MSRMTRNPNEVLSAKQVFIVADVSDSMSREGKFKIEKLLIEAFVAAMPDERYSASIVDFGGRYPYAFYGSQSELNRELSREIRPLQPFSTAGMAQDASQLAFVGEQSPMEAAFGRVRESLAGVRGKAAVLVFSDGQATYEEASLAACKRLVDSYRDEVCIHTVQIGSAPECTDLLKKLAGSSSCGSFRMASDINSPSGMERFVRDVMFVEQVERVVKDSDGDGVPDDKDECPDTPKGVKVDDVGCPIDTDGDGVPDDEDECPDTPKGVKVDDVGCPMDTDGDGVPDDLDECADTLKGAKVDVRGCWVIPGAFFEYDKAAIRPNHRAELDDVARILKRNPDVKLRLEGHTDSRGSEVYNQALSERRARAVTEYLVERGVSGARMTPVGLGESKPIRPNDTEENMAKNRRVELVVVR